MTDPAVDISGARILAVDDVPANLDVLIATLEGENFSVLVATNGTSALEVAAREKPGLILLDVSLPDMDGIEVCQRLKANGDTRDIPVIFLTADTSEERLIAGFQAGAVDYVTKPYLQHEVMTRLRTHLERATLLRELAAKNRELESEIAQRRSLDNRLSMLAKRETDRWGIDGFIGQSATMAEILREIGLLQNASKTSVLIMGESGTGKELIARAIHAGSNRADRPFITVNCSTIPNELAESLLFGHLAGAFTGATGSQTGYFEMADGGTLFLDEVGTMPAAIQPKLLRVLEDGYIRPLGAKADRKVDVRIVSATNEPAGALREDLYYRLARFTVTAPPLRDRKDDIPLLARHFMQMFSDEMGTQPAGLSDDAMDALSAYNYPGNVRELKNVIERAMIESGGQEIRPPHLRLGITGGPPASAAADNQSLDDIPLNLAEAENILIQRALDATNGNVTEAARLLGIDRNKVYRIRSKSES
jgi:DNA-binding NtrC family response regulator